MLFRQGQKKLIIGEKKSDRQIGDNHEGYMIQRSINNSTLLDGGNINIV